ncbi:M48 family metalloprotease [Pseudovibrio sp. Tun.PSC04-5.I4]|uniref:M48 family metalloprotease n=1 Tax=Pseudovibrio sp. Tun.PSC04-5.I4 TaxID=1798213 RepID=UPI0008834C55|nr:M48 family metalloprotease [Pseudovibrio sp. Tun.PSC04-5.I4]SDR31266.1 Putative Zn-dependent protease [Pseudovibrio sp. Tun.PSC04-5.I4]
MTLRYALPGVRTSLKFATVGVVAVALAACQLTGSGNLSSQKPGSLRSGFGSDVGAREHPRVIATYGGVYEDSKAEIAIAKVVGGLVAASEAPDVHYRVTLLNSPAVNAFALPGGYLYVTRGLLALSNDTSELAAVLAHEMAHVSARHAIKRQRQAEEAEFVTKVMSNIGKDQQAIDETVKEKQLQFARFSQEQELEADDVGVRTLAGAGYDPYAAARFLNTMGQFARYQQLGGETSSAPDFLSSHPNTPDRIQRAVRSARQIGAPGIGLNGRADYLGSLDGMLFGDDPLEGYVRGRQFLHKGLGISFGVPKGFVLENSAEAVLASDGAGTAMRFDGADLTGYASLTDYMLSGWINGLIDNSVRPTTINGLPAVIGSAITDGWSFRIGVIRIGLTGYRFIFANRSPTASFAKDFEKSLGSFRQLSPTEQARLNPLRIKIIEAKAGETARKLAVGMSGVEPARRLELFTILNQVKANQRLNSGELLKVITD